MFCSYCGKENADGNRYCGMCGREMPLPTGEAPIPVVTPVPTVLPVAAAPPKASPAPTSWHSPLFALFLAAILPGAGQAYNGQPVKGFFLFFLSILVIPYFISLYDAYANAARIKRAGQSSGCSGFIWVMLQFWLAANTALLVVIALTLAGVFT